MIAPTSVSEAFRHSEGRVVGLVRTVREEPQVAEDLVTLSSTTRQDFEAGAAPFPKEAARQVALQALAAGLLCGALDGVLMLEASRLVEPTCAEPKLQKSLEAAQAMARDNWARMSADELQLLSGYGKHQNRATVEEAEAMAGQPEGQTFLLATFKAGYALGLVDAVLVSRTGEVPGQPAAS